MCRQEDHELGTHARETIARTAEVWVEPGKELRTTERPTQFKARFEGFRRRKRWPEQGFASRFLDFGLFRENEVHGVGLPESLMTEPGLQARIRPEFDLPLVTATGPLGEVSVVPPQIEFSEFELGPRFSGEPNGASKLDWSVFTGQ